MPTLFKLNGLDWREDHRVSEGCISTAALDRYLEHHSEILEIVFCYDNDIDGKLADGTPCNHGQQAALKAVEKYSELGYDVMIQTPNTNDFNSDLLMFKSLLEQVCGEIKEEMER